MSTLPKLTELLESRTVLLLGAGGSFDYGFPLWEQLKESLLALLADNSVPEVSKHDAAAWWIDALNAMSVDDTVDKLAATAPDDAHFDLFRLAIAIVIADFEAKDNSTDGWVELFAEKFAQCLLELPNKDAVNQAVKNFTVVTLNYDRSFNTRFGRLVIKRFSERQLGRDYQKYFREIFEAHLHMVLHPHGSLGATGDPHVSINDMTYQGSGAHLKIGYGDREELLRLFTNQGVVPNITAIDDLKGANNPCYNIVNGRLNVENVLCIGLSETGITQSDLTITRAKHVFYSGSSKVHPNFIPLSMHARPIVEAL